MAIITPKPFSLEQTDEEYRFVSAGRLSLGPFSRLARGEADVVWYLRTAKPRHTRRRSQLPQHSMSKPRSWFQQLDVMYDMVGQSSGVWLDPFYRLNCKLAASVGCAMQSKPDTCFVNLEIGNNDAHDGAVVSSR